MSMQADIATTVVWIAWVVSWWTAAFWSARAVKRPAAGSQALYRVVTIAGAILLFRYFPQGRTTWMLWTMGTSARWVMVTIVAAGLSFTWWARVHLGKLWSGSITRKADHHIVDTGPYRIVRHPIYTGIIIAEIATAIQSGAVQAFLGATLMIVGFYIKARMEEGFLRTQVDAAAYDAYSRRVPMLIPFMRA
jgi:protein-S-isoprenylcysteine O-methyltransferase Ste14